jgi:hypothetical protein
MSAIGLDEASIEKHDDLKDKGTSKIGIVDASVEKYDVLEDEGRSMIEFSKPQLKRQQESFRR